MRANAEIARRSARPASSAKLNISTAAGDLSAERSRMNGTRKLPHTCTAPHTAITAMPGRITGSTTWRRAWNDDAPNTRADSS